MFVALPGFIGSASGGPVYPPYGTLISSHCSGWSAQDAGNENYSDASANVWNGMYTTWQELANGSGGSFWQSLGNNSSDIYSSCWYPFGFYLQFENGENFLRWNGCGNSGSFGPTGSYYNYVQADGNGGTYSNSGGSTYLPPYDGDIIYQSGDGNCCTVYYDGSNSYHVNDTCVVCPPYGTFLGTGCQATTGTDAAGSYYEGAWNYGSFYADGSCGSYFDFGGTNTSGCYLPYGWKFDYTPYSNSLHWVVRGEYASLQAEGDFTYSYGSSSTAVSDGAGGTFPESYSWSASYGDLIANGQYYDPALSINMDYYVYYDGEGGYYVVQYPTP